MSRSLSEYARRVLRSHTGHVLLTISWCFILFVIVRPSLTRPFFVDCTPFADEAFTLTEVNIAYPIWTVIIAGAHFPAILFTRVVVLFLQLIITLSCTGSAKLEIVVFFITSSIQWLVIGFGIDSFAGWIKSRRNNRGIQHALGTDSP